MNDLSKLDGVSVEANADTPHTPITQKAAEATNTAIEGPKTIEIAGYTILAMPLESMNLTPEQQLKFEEAGGLMNPTPHEAVSATPHTMIQWTRSFKTLESEIDGVNYTGFDLFKKVYGAFPDIQSMTEEEAVEAGLYPNINYRNISARKWLAEMHGGHLATLDVAGGYALPYDKNDEFTQFNHVISNGELREIYNATLGKTNLEKFAAMGQAPFGMYDADLVISEPEDGETEDGEAVDGLGFMTHLASGSALGNDYSQVVGLSGYQEDIDVKGFCQNDGDWISTSGVVVLNKK